MKPKHVESKVDGTPGIIIAETATTYIVTWRTRSGEEHTSSISKKGVKFIQE